MRDRLRGLTAVTVPLNLGFFTGGAGGGFGAAFGEVAVPQGPGFGASAGKLAGAGAAASSSIGLA